MDAKIVSFRRGRRVVTPNQMLIEIEGVDSREKAAKLIGKKLLWKSVKGKEIFGTVTGSHGGNGLVKARFSRGLPGQSIGSKVEFK